MKKVVIFVTVFFLFLMFIGCAGLKPQMREIQGSESKKFSYTHAELNLEFKVPAKVKEIRQNNYKFTGKGMPDIFVFVTDQQPLGGTTGGYSYYGLDWYAKELGAMVFDTVKPDGFDWRELFYIDKTSNRNSVGYLTRKHSKLLEVSYQTSFTKEELSEIRGSTHKTRALFRALSELGSWVRIVSKDKSWVGISSKDK
jgi:hypothetical protein